MKTFTNPFEIYSDKKLLVFGLVGAVLVAIISYCSSHLLFGSLKVINNYHQSLPASFVNIAITLFSNIVLLYVFARVRYSRVRFVDICNVVMIAHIVLYILLLMTALLIVQDAIKSVELAVLDSGFGVPNLSTTTTIVLAFFGLTTLLLIVYFFYLLIVGMKIAINSKKSIDGVIVIVIVLVWNTVLQFLNPFII